MLEGSMDIMLVNVALTKDAVIVKALRSMITRTLRPLMIKSVEDNNNPTKTRMDNRQVRIIKPKILRRVNKGLVTLEAKST